MLARASHFMDGYLSDSQFADVLRVTQIALFTGKVEPLKIGGFGDRIANEFPAGSGIINKHLAMLMAYLKNASIDDRIEDYFDQSQNSREDKLFVAMQLQSIGNLLSDTVRFKLIDYLENSMFQTGRKYLPKLYQRGDYRAGQRLSTTRATATHPAKRFGLAERHAAIFLCTPVAINGSAGFLGDSGG